MAPQANLEREALLGHRSRADFLIPASPDIFIEVKAVTLHLDGGRGAFPDAVSQRATRHIAELCDEMAQGRRAALVFCVLHAGISSVQVAGHVDVVFAEALGHAMRKGLEVYTLVNDITSRGIYPRHAERLEALTI
jgi:sugar fermentation stimulation protein A